MGAEIDRLEVQIETEAAKANHELDLLVKKLSLLAEGISAIKSNKGLDEFASKAQSVAKSMESLRSGTKDISKSIGEPAKKVAKSFDEIASKYKDLGKGFEFFGNVQSIQRKIETLSNALEDAKIRAQELEAAGKTDGTMYDSAVRDVVKYQNQIESLKKQLEEIGKIKENHEIKIQYITDSEQTLDDFKRQLESFDKIVESGGKQSESGETMFPVRGLEMTLENLREMYPEAKELMSSYEAEIERAKSLTIGGMAQYGKINLESFAPTGETTNKVKEFGEALSSLEVPEIREENLDKLRNSLEKAEEKLDKLRANLANGLTMGRITESPDDKGYRNIQEQIALTEKTVDALREKISNTEKEAGRAGGFSTLKKSMLDVDKSAKYISQSFSKVISVIKKFGVTIKSVISKLGRMIKSMLMLGNTSKKSNASFGNGLKTILKYGFGIRSLYVLVNKLRTAIKDGMENLVQYSEKTNQSVSTLSSSLNQLKNASAAAVAPILNAIAPALNAIIQLFIRAANAVNQFFSALTGNGTWIKAKYVYNDVADGISKASKAAKGALQPFDALNNLTTQDSSGSGTNPGDMFETVPVDSKFKDLADWLKDMWKDADFYDLGRLLGDKLKSALESIPWSKIKKTLRKIAKSIATFLNGFLETPGLFKVIGKTIAEGINSAFEFVDEFVWDFHWKSLGQAIVDTVQGLVDNLDWDVISSAITGLAYGLVALFNTIFGATETWGDVGMTIAKAINTILQGLFLFVHNFDFAAFGTSIGTLLSDALTNIAYWKLGDILANGINGAFTALYNFCETFDWVKLATKIADGINKALENLDWEQIQSAVESLATHLGEWIDTFVGEIDWEKVGSTIGHIIQLALDFVYTLKDTIDWTKVKEAIFSVLKSAINEIDMGELATLLLGLLSASIAVKATTAVFKEVGKRIMTSLASAIISAASAFAAAIKGLVPVIASALKTTLTADMAAIFSSGSAATIAAYIGTALVAAFAAWMAGNWTGKQLGALLFPDMSEEYENFSWLGEGGFFDQLFGDIDFSKAEEVKQCFEDLRTAWVDMHTDFENNPVTALIMGIMDPLGLLYANLKNLKDNAQETFDTISNALQTCIDSWKQLFEGFGVNLEIWWSETWLSDALWNFGQWWDEKVAPWFTQEKWSELWNNIKQSAVTKWSEIKQTITDKITETKENIINKVNEIKNNWNSSWDNLKSKVTSVMDSIKSKFKGVMDWIEDKISSFNSKISELKEKMSNLFSGSKMSSLGFSSNRTRATKMKGFANGGFPEPYSIIGVGEGGKAEMFGTVGGKTAIAGNGEITGIADAVYNTGQTEASLLQMAVSLLQTIADKPTISKDDVFGMTQSAYNEKANRCGYTKDPVFG